MTKSSNPSSLKTISFEEDWSSHPAVEWLSARKNILVWGFFALVAVLLIASRLMTWQTLNAEKDFFQAQTMFSQFQQAAMNPTESAIATEELEKLQALMDRHPELKPKYEGALAQTLLINGQTAQAEAFAQDIFKRTTPDHLQLYQDYTQTSLLISQGSYADALRQAQQLKLTLEQSNAEANSLLYVFNLVRLGLLYQQTQQPQEELKVWEALQNQPQHLESLLSANQVLNIGQASLNQYIAERISHLR